MGNLMDGKLALSETCTLDGGCLTTGSRDADALLCKRFIRPSKNTGKFSTHPTKYVFY